MRGTRTTPATHADRTVLRDAALARISRTRRWALAGAAALTAGLAALASALLPGKSFGAKAGAVHIAARSATSNSSGTPALPAPANAAQLGIGGESSQSAVPAPTPAPAPQSAPAAVSGGS